MQRIDRLEGSLTSLIRNEHRKRSPTSSKNSFIHGGTLPASPTLDVEGTAKESSQETPPPSASLLRASHEMSIEAMLKWPIFNQCLRSQDNKHLAKPLAVDAEFSDPRRAADSRIDVNMDLSNVEPVVESFIANILPSSPILDPVEVRQQVREVVEHGLLWNGHSCLAVSLC